MLDVSRLVGSVLDAVDFERLGFKVSWCEVSEVNPIFKGVGLGISIFETIVEFKLVGYVNYDIYLGIIVGSSLLDLHYCKLYKVDGSKVYKHYKTTKVENLQDYLKTQFL